MNNKEILFKCLTKWELELSLQFRKNALNYAFL